MNKIKKLFQEMLVLSVVLTSSCSTTLDLGHLSIPERLGVIKRTFSGNGTRKIVIIEEEHDNVEVQKNIMAIVSLLYEKYDIRNVCIENPEGVFDFSFYHENFQNRELLEKIMFCRLADSRISGMEYVAATFPRISISGIDDIALRNEQKSILESPSISNGLENLKGQFNDLQKEIMIVQDKLNNDVREQLKALRMQEDDISGEDVSGLNQLIEVFNECRNNADALLSLIYELAVNTSCLNRSFKENYNRWRALSKEVDAFNHEKEKMINLIDSVKIKRDEKMVENVLHVMNSSADKCAVMNIGAAHTRHITKIFKNRNVSFSVVKPKGIESGESEIGLNVNEKNRRLKPTIQLNQEEMKMRIAMFYQAALINKQSGSNRNSLANQLKRLQSYLKLLAQRNFSRGKLLLFKIKDRVRGVFVCDSSSNYQLEDEDIIDSIKIDDEQYILVSEKKSDELQNDAMIRDIARYSNDRNTYLFIGEANDKTRITIDHKYFILSENLMKVYEYLIDAESGSGKAGKIIGELAEKIFQACPGNGQGGNLIICNNAGGLNAGDSKFGNPFDVNQSHLLGLLRKEAERKNMNINIFNTFNPSIADSNLKAQMPMFKDNKPNFQVIIDEKSLSKLNNGEAKTETLKNSFNRIEELPYYKINSSMNSIRKDDNIVIVTAHSEAELQNSIEEAGGKGSLKGKTLLLITCGDACTHRFARMAVEDYGAAGVAVPSFKISFEEALKFIDVLIGLIKSAENRGLTVFELIEKAAEILITGYPGGYDSFRNFRFQVFDQSNLWKRKLC